MSLFLAAGVNATLAKPKPRNWQPGEVTRIERPGDAHQPGSGTIGPPVISGEPVIMPEPSSFEARWAIAIALPDAIYVVTLPPPPQKSSLTRLKAGSKLECAVEGKTMYLKDEKGSVFRASIRQRSAQ